MALVSLLDHLRPRARPGAAHHAGVQPGEQWLAEAFVGTFKRDYVTGAELRDMLLAHDVWESRNRDTVRPREAGACLRVYSAGVPGLSARDYFEFDEAAQVFLIATDRNVRHTLVIPRDTFRDADFTRLLNQQLVTALKLSGSLRLTLTPQAPKSRDREHPGRSQIAARHRQGSRNICSAPACVRRCNAVARLWRLHAHLVAGVGGPRPRTASLRMAPRANCHAVRPGAICRPGGPYLGISDRASAPGGAPGRECAADSVHRAPRNTGTGSTGSQPAIECRGLDRLVPRPHQETAGGPGRCAEATARLHPQGATGKAMVRRVATPLADPEAPRRKAETPQSL
jgi:hypothetical protein